MKFSLFFVFMLGAFSVSAQTPETKPASEMAMPDATPAPAVVAPVAAVTPKKETPKDEPFQFFGDFRYRQQMETQSPKQQRSIQRIQARFGVSSQVHEDLKVTLRLMTGSSANSGNQTLGDEKAPGMPRRNFGLDQVYFDYKPVSMLNIYGGKMPQPFTFVGKNQLILDRDISLEGLGLKYNQPLSDEWSFFAQGGMFWIRENYDSQFGEEQTDNFLNAVQAGAQWKANEWTVLFGVGSFSYTDLKDNPPANITSGATGNGNTLDINGNYPTNFDIEEMFVEVKKKVGSVDLTAFYETLKNKDAETPNKAYSYGLLAGYKAWSFSWAQQEIQKDAVLGVFTDSDFGGGVTSTRGSVWSVAYKITKKVQVQYTVFKNENAIDLIPKDYDRTHIDLSMTF
ncbi:putative porin [Bdellovibrio bacteriovorus]|uniref:putative porin n=1 Tax=Bdellovibrio TaxID=958 RepID=UPI0035A955D8